MSEESTQGSQSNRHIREYLQYYISMPHPPHFAVLVDGPWGLGKTHLIRRILQDTFASKDEYAYVSLYGLTDIAGIDEALAQAIYPALGWTGTKILGRAAKVGMKYFRVDPEIKVADLVDKSGKKLYIFDDLERCEIPINKVMGYLNELVEHDGSKVLIIANQNEIKEEEDYRRRREKLIGKTLEAQSVFDEALTHFISRVPDQELAAFYSTNSAVIAEVFHQSGLQNLRILQQTMWDFERFYDALSDEHKKHSGVLAGTLRLIFSLSFELKSARLTANDLRSRMKSIVAARMSRKNAGDVTALILATQERYPGTDFGDTTLPDELLIDFLVKGVVDAIELRSALDRSPYFAPQLEEPAWRTVWHGFERSDEQFAAAFERMEAQFLNREIHNIGEILHVFGLRLWLAEVGVLQKTRLVIVSEGKQYIDDLFAQRHLEPASENEYREFSMTGYAGLVIYENKAAEFRELFAYLQQKREEVARDRMPDLAANLLEEMTADPALFYRRINLTNSEDNLYFRTPVLASVDPNAFVSALLAMPPAQHRTIFAALKSRYEHGTLNRGLPSERPWLIAVRDMLQQARVGLPPFRSHQIERMIEWYLTPVLDEELPGQ